MAIAKTIAMLLLASVFFVSCKKDDDKLEPTASSTYVEGLYSGKYGFGNDVPDTPIKYYVKSGGVFQQISIHTGNVVANGTWQLAGTTLTATYTSVFSPYSKESISATFNSATKKLTGTWGSGNSYTNGGKLDLTK